MQAAQPGQGFHFPPPEPDPNYPYHQPQQSQWGGPPQQGGPAGYDLGSYMPSGAQPHGQPDPGQYQAGPYAAPFGPAQNDYAEQDAGYGDEYLDEEEEDEPRRGRRWLFIVAALVGAIGVGGAMAYTYKSFVAPSGRVPVVKAGDPNVKVRPDNRAERKMPVRIVDEPGRPTPASADERPADDNGPRRVRTIPIVPGAAPQQAEPEGAPTQVSGMPGIMLDAPRRPPPQPPSPSAAQEPPARVVIGRPPVAPQPAPSAAGEEPASGPAVRRPPAQVIAPAVAKPAPPPAASSPSPAAPVVAKARPAPAPAPPAASTGAGYVAVISSQKTRMDALKKFADLQQKHEVLAGKTPDVQEADLSARGLGTMYRLVVGPPGSRQAAAGVCTQLKSAGQDCWIKEY